MHTHTHAHYLQSNPLRYSKILLPLFYALTIAVNFFSILYSGAPMLGLADLEVTSIVLIALGFGVIVFFGVLFLYIPRLHTVVEAMIKGLLLLLYGRQWKKT